MADTMHAIMEAHRAALAACDSEDDPSGPLNMAERQAWTAFVAAPCVTREDAQAKVAYVTASERLLAWMEDEENDPAGFLRSLRLPMPAADPFVERMRRYHADVDAYNNSGRDDDVDPWHAFESEVESGAVIIASAAGAAEALRQVVALDAVGCMESELWIAKVLAFLEGRA